jgi:type I restriction enzyme S subunit
MRAFEEQARYLYERIVAAERDSRTLATLRETLLPKLISCELRVGGRKKAIPGDDYHEVDYDSRRQP